MSVVNPLFLNSPGKFFSVVVMKVMMTYVLMNYDIKQREVESRLVTENLANGSGGEKKSLAEAIVRPVRTGEWTTSVMSLEIQHSCQWVF